MNTNMSVIWQDGKANKYNLEKEFPSLFLSLIQIFIQYEVSLLAHLQSIPTKATTKPSVFQRSQISGKQFFLLLIWKTVSSQAEHEANKFQWIIAWLSRLITQIPSYKGNMEEATKEKVRYCDTSRLWFSRPAAKLIPFSIAAKLRRPWGALGIQCGATKWLNASSTNKYYTY